MKLNQPKTITIDHRADLPSHLNYLAGEPAYIEAKLKPGGFLNPQYMTALEGIDMQRRVGFAAIDQKDPEAFAKARDKVLTDTGAALVEAAYDNCVASWSTNIQSDGEAVEPSRENYLALAKIGIPEINKWFTSVSRKVMDVERFITDEDEAMAKN